MSDLTTISITKKTRNRLYDIAGKGQTWDELMNELIGLKEKKVKK